MMTTRARALSTILAAATLTVSACGGSSGSHSAAPTSTTVKTGSDRGDVTEGEQSTGAVALSTSTTARVTSEDDACGMLDQDEAAKALGRPVRDGESTSTDGEGGARRTCTYHVTDGTTSVVKVMLLGTEIPRDVFDDQTAEMDGRQSVDGVGDVAWFMPGVLMTYADGTWLTVQIVRDGAGVSDVDVLRTVATTALERI